MIIFILGFVIILIYLTCKSNLNYWKIRKVPFIKPTPIFGNIFPLITGKLQASALIHKFHRSTNEPYLGLYIFHQPFILIRDLDIMKHVLLKDFDHFINKSMKTSKHDRIGRNLLLLQQGQNWRTARKSVSPIFTPNKLKLMFPLINEVSDDLMGHIGNIQDDKSHNFRDISIKYAVDVVATCFFGLQIKSLEKENSECFQATQNFFKLTFGRSIQILSSFFVPQIIVDFFNVTFLNKSSMDYMEQVFLKMMKDRKLSSTKRNDLIDILNELTESDFDNESLASLAVTILSAGYESTGSALSYVWYELGCNKNIQECLRNEVHTLIQIYKEFSYEAVTKMNYLEMVINETLRKYPLLGFLNRLCVKDYKVPNTDLVIEKGTGIYISSEALHYDEQYFPNPNKFDPERFSVNNKHSFPEYAYMPFGKGFRGCIGARFAALALKVAIAKVIMNFEIDVCQDTPLLIRFDPRGVIRSPANEKLKLTFKRIQLKSHFS